MNEPSHPVPAATATPSRLTGIDAYRGFVMFLMVAEVLRISRIATSFPDNPVWQFLKFHTSHVEWTGCSLHDMIQPSFSFLVGVALPYSIASRQAKGQSFSLMFGHAVWRALLLILLGVFLRSTGKPMTNWTFEDTLSQIGMGYVFLFVIGMRPLRFQWTAFALVVAGYWAAFVMFPMPPADFNYAAVGVPVTWQQDHLFSGFMAHWNKNSNLAWAADQFLLNLFPRPQPFQFNGGGYATLSFIPTLGTMILGSIAGGWLRAGKPVNETLKRMVIAGVAGLVIGLTLQSTGICPVVKRIWTPAWVFFSGGWCFLLLAGFHTVVDVKGYRRWAFPLIVIGMNSIAIYCMDHLFTGFIVSSLKTHLGQDSFKVFGPIFEPLLLGVSTMLVYWLILFWMYRRKLFLKV
ncbi:MAG TPA: hypothetical protein VK968_17020 [Roseimicrobium sp.]|nr:hypothetical protein [Roseimicrobium sp.]